METRVKVVAEQTWVHLFCLQSKTAGSVGANTRDILLDVSSIMRNHKISVLFTCLLFVLLLVLLDGDIGVDESGFI